MRKGYVDLPLHSGNAPKWLFSRMVALARAIMEALVMEFGPEEALRRLADPIWFQSLGCVLGFDWHSSGLTTTTTAAIKEGIRGMEQELGIIVAGGKGRTSRKTPDEIRFWADKMGFNPERLIYASRMAAKVDSAALQDGYQIYHHAFFFTPKGDWAVVQQGMNTSKRYSRRYHWLSNSLESFVVEPHFGIISSSSGHALNLTARTSNEARKTIAELSKEPPSRLIKELVKLKELKLPRRHELMLKDIEPQNIKKTLLRTYEYMPNNFEELLSIRGVGPKSIRALALVADLIYGAKPSYEDPFVYSFAHGGKDGTPYPVNRRIYDRTIEVLESAIKSARIGNKEKLAALRRLSLAFQSG